MASTRFQLKRSTISGVIPTTSDIAAGELGLNLADRKIFTSNGSVISELGANLTNHTVSANLTVGNGTLGNLIFLANTRITANGTIGSNGQVLSSNGAGLYWGDPSSGSGSAASTIVAQQFTANGTATSFTVTGGYMPGGIEVFLNGIKQLSAIDVNITSGTVVQFLYTPSTNQTIDIFGHKSPHYLSVSQPNIDYGLVDGAVTTTNDYGGLT